MNTASEAENKPVYDVLVYAQINLNADTKTHENEDPIGIFLRVQNHLVVFILCGLGVHGEKLSRAVTKFRFSLRW